MFVRGQITTSKNFHSTNLIFYRRKHLVEAFVKKKYYFNDTITLFRMYILCSFETVQHFEGIVSEFFSKIQTNLVMIYIFLYQDYLVPKPKTNFSLKSQRDALAWACNFVALVKQLSCERHLIFFMPQGNFSHFYPLYCVFFQVLLQKDFFFQYIVFGLSRDAGQGCM